MSMNKFEMYIKKYGILLDCITLILCAALVAKSVLGTSTFLVTDSFINVEVIYKVLLVIAIIKLYFCFDIRDKKYIGAAVLLILAVIFYVAGWADYRYLIFPMVALYEVSFEDVAKVFALSSGFCLCVILITSLTGIIQNASSVREESTSGYAYLLGFEHHSWFMMHWLFVMFAVIYIVRRNRFRGLVYPVLLIITVALWFVTDSNTSGIVGVMVCLGMILDSVVRLKLRPIRPFMRKFQDSLMKLSIVMPIVSVLLTVLGCIYFGIFGYGRFSTNMLSRFHLTLTALEALGVELPFSVTDERWDISMNWFWGTRSTVSFEGYVLDNVYAKLLIENGLIILIAYLILQMIVRYDLYKKKQYALALMCFWVSVFGIFESRAFTTFSCALLSTLLFTRVPRMIRGRKNIHKKIMRTGR